MEVRSYLFAVFSFVVTLGMVSGTLVVSGHELPTGTIGLVAALLLLPLATFTKCKVGPSVFVSCIGLLLIFGSNLFRSHYSLVPFNRIFPELCALILIYFGLSKVRKFVIYILALSTPCILLYCLLDTCNGRILFSDDHATFLYRLQMLKEHFPFIPFYNPLWNAGIDERYFFATGTLNIFFLTAPLLYLLDLWKYYTLIPAFILFLLAPGAAFAATRLTGGNSRAGALSILLALASGLGWYQWGIFFGPLGYLTTSALTPLLAALAARILDKEHRLSALEAALTVCTATLVLFWSPGGLMFLPAIVLGVVFLKRTISKRYVPTIVTLLIVINLPWVLVFWSASNVGGFLQKSEDVRKVSVVSGKSFRESARTESNQNSSDTSSPAVEHSVREKVFEHLDEASTLLQRNFQSANPLILFLAIPALFLFPSRYRLFFATMSLWLFTMGTLIAPLKEQLELDRMLVSLCLLLSVPVGHLLDSFFTTIEENRSWHNRLAAAFVLSFVTLAIMGAGAILRERTPVRVAVASPLVHSLAEAIDTHSESGRALFTGFVLHDLDGGHFAPLSTLAKTPLIASSQVHKHWKYKDVIPPEYLGEGATKIEEYLSLMNVSTVISTERTWRSYLQEHPELYEKVWQQKNFFMFRRTKHSGGYFLEGKGEIITQSSNGVTFSLEKAGAVLRFQYFPFLRAASCTIEPHPVSESITFVRLSNCPTQTAITLESKPAYVRINL